MLDSAMAEILKATGPSQESLKQTHEQLSRQFHASVVLMAQQRREVSYLQTMASWALRISPTGWATVRDGRLVFTNRAFDALDRGSVIGPGWSPLGLDLEPESAAEEQPAPSLRAIAVEQALLLSTDGTPHRRQRFARGGNVVELVVERPVSHAESNVALILVRDVTEEVRAEARVATMSARLNEIERTHVAAELAIGVAHDLGNLVAALRTRVAMLAGNLAVVSETEALQKIVEAQSGLVQKLQAVAHPRAAAAVRLNLLDEVVRPAIQLVETSLRIGSLAVGGRISIRVDSEGMERLVVWAPRDELVNVLINLFFNARDAMPDGGTITVSAASAPWGVRVRVEDEGIGIAPSHLSRIFEPLFSTKGDRGMGLGLATAAAMMRRLGGTIAARNRAGRGACIELTFVDPDHVDPGRASPHAR